MPVIPIGNYLRVAKLARPKDRKTDTYMVLSSTEGASELGRIRWHGAWRCYAFFPAPETLFEEDCLRDLARFLDVLREERKKDGRCAIDEKAGPP